MPRPDEGLIHAWLDGQLPPEEAARIEALAATDAEWAAAVAEARGLVAASSRILSALDHVPAGVVPKRASVRTGQRLPWWTKIAAAVVVVVGGSVVVMQNAPDVRLPAVSTEQGSAQPTPDTQRLATEGPVAPPPVPATTAPGTTAPVPAAASIAGVPAGAVIGREEIQVRRREARAAEPAAPAATPAPSAKANVAVDQRSVQDAERQMAEMSAPKSLVAKIAPSTAPSVAQNVAPSPVQTAAPQAQQASMQDLAQAQNAARAQRGLGGVVALRSAQGQQAVLCYRLVPDSAHAGVVAIMRTAHADGDTLRLVPVDPDVLLRAWIVLRNGAWRGAAVPVPAGRDTIPIVASRVACPAP
jgi:hypothetical protein